LDVQPGESLALVGSSGAGKTTLLHLILRFFDPTGGLVLAEGQDVRGLKLSDWRGQIALVPQEPVILPGTVMENIAYGKPGAGSEQVVAAAQAASADAFIRRLPDGYHTLLGDGASVLSVGERQRLNLARAFLKDAPLLLMDEPTSALDAENESAILEALDRVRQGRTCLIIAHHWNTLKSLDRVLLLNQGRLRDVGSPGQAASDVEPWLKSMRDFR